MSVENTSQRPPEAHLLGMLDDGADRYITDMESAGQRQVVASSVLPVKGPWDALAELGFVKGEPVDELFVKAELPAGWSKEGSDHAMHSYIVDERGIRRVDVFYKAAFYDRRADMHLMSVGGAAATKMLYGEGPVKLPEHWAAFTSHERAETIVGLNYMDQNIAECPQVYGKYSDRLAAARALVTP